MQLIDVIFVLFGVKMGVLIFLFQHWLIITTIGWVELIWQINSSPTTTWMRDAWGHGFPCSSKSYQSSAWIRTLCTQANSNQKIPSPSITNNLHWVWLRRCCVKLTGISSGLMKMSSEEPLPSQHQHKEPQPVPPHLRRSVHAHATFSKRRHPQFNHHHPQYHPYHYHHHNQTSPP